MGLWTGCLVLLSLGSVVELDLELYQELQKSLAEDKLPRYDFSRKMPLQKDLIFYVVDYLARIWPLGEDAWNGCFR